MPSVVDTTEVDPTTSTASEAVRLWPAVARYRKLAVAFVGTTGPFVAYLLAEAHSAADIAGAATAYLLVNLGVYGVSNES
jgi:hypothetical protein